MHLTVPVWTDWFVSNKNVVNILIAQIEGKILGMTQNWITMSGHLLTRLTFTVCLLIAIYFCRETTGTDRKVRRSKVLTVQNLDDNAVKLKISSPVAALKSVLTFFKFQKHPVAWILLSVVEEFPYLKIADRCWVIEIPHFISQQKGTTSTAAACLQRYGRQTRTLQDELRNRVCAYLLLCCSSQCKQSSTVT